MNKAELREQYRMILESLEIPARAPRRRSQRTPEWETLSDLRERFSIPDRIQTLDPLADWLADNIEFDELFEFLSWLIRPIARMVVEILDFLNVHQRTATSAQTIKDIRIGADVRLPVDLRNMPRVTMRVLAEVGITEWNVTALTPLLEPLNSLYHVATCDGRHRTSVCRPDMYRRCRDRVQLIARDIDAILRADDVASRLPLTGEHGLAAPDGAEGESNWQAKLPEELTRTMRRFVDACKGPPLEHYKAASDCIPGQRRTFDSLFTQQAVAHVEQILSAAKTSRLGRMESLKEFLKLPYWRHRNDLFEVWTLARACGHMLDSQVDLSNVDEDGQWVLPGNSQGKITKPVLTIRAPCGRFAVFTGLRLQEYRLPFERTAGSEGAMPDWLFCRIVKDRKEFDFTMLGKAGVAFEREGLVPEFIIECKAGASYPLLETILDPMVLRYVPLLRTARGRALLVNYRRFAAPSDLARHPVLRTLQRHRYSQVTVIEPLAPGEEDAEAEFEQSVAGFFNDRTGLPSLTVDLVLVFDTTGSMPQGQEFRETLGKIAAATARDLPGLRVAAVAVGDHSGEPEDYVTKLCCLTNDVDEVIDFMRMVAPTKGGDRPEAYEDALRVLRSLTWRPSAAKLVLFVGDSFPHRADDCPQAIDWEEELAHLTEAGVKFHGVRFSDEPACRAFFQRLSSATGGQEGLFAAGDNIVAAIEKWFVTAQRA